MGEKRLTKYCQKEYWEVKNMNKNEKLKTFVKLIGDIFVTNYIESNENCLGWN